jgi:hypothetical protein
VREIDTALVLSVLEPIWKKKPETASRLRGRIESVISYATVREYRSGENPARWRGHLDQMLPRRSKNCAGRASRRFALREHPGVHGGVARESVHQRTGAGVYDPDGREDRRDHTWRCWSLRSRMG